MLKKIRKINESKFSCTPRSVELNIVCGLSFYYNPDTCLFEVDQNPYGERDLIPIKNLQFSPDYSKMTFDCFYQGKDVSFDISIGREREKNFLRFFHAFHGKAFFFGENDFQPVVLLFDEGEISANSNIRNPEKGTDYLTLFGEDGEFFFIIPRPWKRFPLSAFGSKGNTFYFKSEENLFEYEFILEPSVMQVVKAFLQMELSNLDEIEIA
ncbi:hypothetical protein BCF11_0634 [Collimonas sp. PA-H2]|uniref:hypothetical protein n=1 Tax=Collimonas sp. PA-H2 TaxID=1881062 RepID=UPI000C003582|nr:hypothetical protein [Collimonas sp. PA-H2]PFH08281.1 hypothetical protein BCF11_0634 [Collimonas sp. PA-H2]